LIRSLWIAVANRLRAEPAESANRMPLRSSLSMTLQNGKSQSVELGKTGGSGEGTRAVAFKGDSKSWGYLSAFRWLEFDPICSTISDQTSAAQRANRQPPLRLFSSVAPDYRRAPPPA